MDMIIFSGQSNMQGQTESTATVNSTPVDNALEYRFLTDELIPLACPVGENIEHTGEGFEKGKYKTYFVMGVNCTYFVNQIFMNSICRNSSSIHQLSSSSTCWCQ